MDYQIINGDCLTALKGMEDKSVDIVVTSPPYNQLPQNVKEFTGMHKGGKWFEKAKAGYADARPEPEYQSWLREVIGECLRISKGLVWVNHKTRYRKKQGIHPLRFLPFDFYAEVIWQRSGGVAFNCRKYVPNYEFIYGFGTPHYWDRCNDLKFSVWQITQARSTEHPCPFPVEIPKRLIQSSCPVGGTVLDPFAGIGTTGSAAMSLDRRFIGVELDASYCETAQRRLDEVVGSSFSLDGLRNGNGQP